MPSNRIRMAIMALCGMVSSLGGLSLAEAADPGQRPRVLILGDSISIGYTPHVQAGMKDDATVVRPTRPNGKAENCAGTTYGVTEIDRWLAIDGGNWDIIHFNFGLHDLKRVDPKNGAASNNPSDPRQAESDAYEKNLRRIVERLQSTDAILIFATTTPVPAGKLSPHRDPEDIERYNAIARRIMKEQGIAIDDLYGFARSRLDEIQQPANVHFTSGGSKQLATQVERAIRKSLKAASTSRAAVPSE